MIKDKKNSVSSLQRNVLSISSYYIHVHTQYVQVLSCFHQLLIPNYEYKMTEAQVLKGITPVKGEMNGPGIDL